MRPSSTVAVSTSLIEGKFLFRYSALVKFLPAATFLPLSSDVSLIKLILSVVTITSGKVIYSSVSKISRPAMSSGVSAGIRSISRFRNNESTSGQIFAGMNSNSMPVFSEIS